MNIIYSISKIIFDELQIDSICKFEGDNIVIAIDVFIIEQRTQVVMEVFSNISRKEYGLFEVQFGTTIDLEALVFLKDEIRELDFRFSWNQKPTSYQAIGQLENLEWLLTTMNDFVSIPDSFS